VRQRHGALGSADFVADLVQSFEQYADLSHVRGDEHDRPPAIGLDLESEYEAGVSIPVRASVEGAPAGPAGMSAVLRAAGGRVDRGAGRMNASWPRWNLAGEPSGLAKYAGQQSCGGTRRSAA
jgi:hypothetical protein